MPSSKNRLTALYDFTVLKQEFIQEFLQAFLEHLIDFYTFLFTTLEEALHYSLRFCENKRQAWILRYGLAVVAVWLVSMFKWYSLGVVSYNNPYLLFPVAIVLSTWFGGLRSGLIATLLSVISAVSFFTPTVTGIPGMGYADWVVLAIFIFQGLFISFMGGMVHFALRNQQAKTLALEESEKKFRSLVDSMSDIVFLLDAHQRLSGVFGRWLSTVKYSHTTVIGKDLTALFGSEFATHQPYIDQALAGQSVMFESRSVFNGHTFYFHNSLSPVLSSKGRVKGVVGVSRDITDKVVADQRKDEFLSIASHELKTPLTSITVFTQLLQRDKLLAAQPKLAQYLDRINTQLHKLTTLVQDLLDMSKIQQGKLEFKWEVFPLRDLVQEIIEDIRPITAKHTLVFKGQSQIKVRADRFRLGQVFTNLLTNAIKYTPQESEIQIRLLKKEGAAVVSIQDQGIGIPTAAQAHIFKRFYRVAGTERDSYPGFGLGLYISQQIIQRHQGEVWFESIENQGATFYVKLPAAVLQ